MKPNIRLSFSLLLLPLILTLLVTNAYAFLVTTELASFSVQFVPAEPNSTMSVEWDSYSGSANARAYQKTDDNAFSDQDSVTLHEPESTTVTAATKDVNVAVAIDDNEAQFTVDMGEDTEDILNYSANWDYERDFTIHGDGYMIISAVHDADYERPSPDNLLYSSDALLSLHNFSKFRRERAASVLSDIYPGLTRTLKPRRIFFNDGDVGRLSVHLSAGTSPYPNPVPIPGALWLLGSGLSFLVAFKRKGR